MLAYIIAGDIEGERIYLWKTWNASLWPVGSRFVEYRPWPQVCLPGPRVSIPSGLFRSLWVSPPGLHWCCYMNAYITANKWGTCFMFEKELWSSLLHKLQKCYCQQSIWAGNGCSSSSVFDYNQKMSPPLSFYYWWGGKVEILSRLGPPQGRAKASEVLVGHHPPWILPWNPAFHQEWKNDKTTKTRKMKSKVSRPYSADSEWASMEKEI